MDNREVLFWIPSRRARPHGLGTGEQTHRFVGLGLLMEGFVGAVGMNRPDSDPHCLSGGAREQAPTPESAQEGHEATGALVHRLSTRLKYVRVDLCSAARQTYLTHVAFWPRSGMHADDLDECSRTVCIGTTSPDRRSYDASVSWEASSLC